MMKSNLSRTPPAAAEYHGERLTEEEIAAIEALPSQLPPPCSILRPDAPTLDYRGRVFRFRYALHNGQRKLLVGLLEFLQGRGERAPEVVYAGAAPGHNITEVARRFPRHAFHLYDPARIYTEGPNVTVYRQLFTDEDAQHWRGRPVLFVSDIRTPETGADNQASFEAKVQENMRDQGRWVRTMRPAAAMLKFRLPYAGGQVRYLDGELHLQAWASNSGTEARLWVDDPDSEREYDSRLYEGQMFYVNTVLREWGHYGQGCGCHDCALEHAICGQLPDQGNWSRRVPPHDPDGGPGEGETRAVWRERQMRVAGEASRRQHQRAAGRHKMRR